MVGPSLDTAAFASARLWAASRAPYLASALFACTPVAAPGSGSVAADRGWRLHFDPDKVAELDVPELGKLLVHLAGHLIRDHGHRADAVWVGDEGADRWQQCADAEINDDLAVSGLLPPVAGTVPADIGMPDGRLVEEYFAQLAQQPGPDSAEDARWDCGSAADGRPRPWDSGDDNSAGLNSEEADRLRRGVAEEIRRAHERDPGSVPGGWLGWAEGVLRSTTDWRRLIAAEIRRAVAIVSGSVDYTYRRPSRRSSAAASSESRVVLPSLFRPVPEVAIVCDTSGSMDETLLAQVISEVDAILARAGLRAIGATTLSVDTEVHATQRVRRAAEVALLGGGGTDMAAGISAALARRPKPELVVVLTDGFTPWPTEAPRGARVVVGLVGHADVAPDPPQWARVVRIPPGEVGR